MPLSLSLSRILSGFASLPCLPWCPVLRQLCSCASLRFLFDFFPGLSVCRFLGSARCPCLVSWLLPVLSSLSFASGDVLLWSLRSPGAFLSPWLRLFLVAQLRSLELLGDVLPSVVLVSWFSAYPGFFPASLSCPVCLVLLFSVSSALLPRFSSCLNSFPVF